MPDAIPITLQPPPILELRIAPPVRLIAASPACDVLDVAMHAPPTLQLRMLVPPAVLAAEMAAVLVGPPGVGSGGACAAPPISPAMTYTGDLLTGITYADGSTKALTYASDRVTRIDFVRPGAPGVRKDFSYSGDGNLTAVAQSAF